MGDYEATAQLNSNPGKQRGALFQPAFYTPAAIFNVKISVQWYHPCVTVRVLEKPQSDHKTCDFKPSEEREGEKFPGSSEPQRYFNQNTKEG